MRIRMNGGKVSIDGKTFSGSNISINGNKVIVDGKVQDGELVGDISVVVHGDVESVENTNGDVTCNNSNSITTTNGEVRIKGSVTGNVRTTNGDVTAAIVHGDINTVNGDISK